MKKFIALAMCLALILALLAGCGISGNNAGGASVSAVKTGLAIVTSLSSSTDASASAAGLVEVDSTAVAVTVGADGKIVNCKIDVAQTKVNFDQTGKISTDLTAPIKSKQELGADYGLIKASKIGKEWYQQADAFAQYCIGKTADEVKGIAVTADGHASGADLTSSVTIHVVDFITAVTKAVANAQDLGATSSDKLGLGIDTGIGSSTSASSSAAGLAEVDSYYTASTFGSNGKITSSAIDATQAKVNFSKEGKITSDLKAEVKTKQELKEDYGMKKASKIGKEWYEEANAFAKYVTGKTVDEVKGIAVNQGIATGADLTSSVTIHITDFQNIIAKASANAK